MSEPIRINVARNERNRKVIPAHQVIVLVGGTVDPTNLYADENAPRDLNGRPKQLTHSRGYSEHADRAKDPAYWTRDKSQLGDAEDGNWYWQDNTDFRPAIERLRKRHRDAHLFTLHGWSGDNNPENRRSQDNTRAIACAVGGGTKASIRHGRSKWCSSI